MIFTTSPERSYTDGGNIIQQTGLHGDTCRRSIRGHNSALPLAAGISCQENRMRSDSMPILTFPKECVALQVLVLPQPCPCEKDWKSLAGRKRTPALLLLFLGCMQIFSRVEWFGALENITCTPPILEHSQCSN